MLDLSHKKLKAWQKAILLLPLIYRLCEKLPRDETYNLIGQMKRAGLSVSNNLAEGSARKSKPEKNRFYEVARSSLVEVDNCLIASIAVRYLKKDDLKEVDAAIVEVFKLITGLIDSNLEQGKVLS